jgi:hypothetical protein
LDPHGRLQRARLADGVDDLSGCRQQLTPNTATRVLF